VQPVIGKQLWKCIVYVREIVAKDPCVCMLLYLVMYPFPGSQNSVAVHAISAVAA